MADEKQKFENIKAVLGDGRTRTIYIVGLLLVGVVAIFAVWSFAGKKSPRHAGTGSEVSKLPNVQNNHTAPDGSPKAATPAYDQLLENQNKEEAERAKREGNSAIPVMRTGVGEKKETPAPQQPVQPAPQPAQAQQADTRQYEEEQRKRQEAINARAQAMKNQVNLLLASWAPKEHVNMPVAPKDNQKGSSPATLTATSTSGAKAQTKEPARKAGDTCYAMLDTAVNTDEPSPVTATIHQCGELNQAKLIGKVEVPQNAQIAQKAQLKFSDINVPGQPTSLPIDAVAIDETTRRTALASDVDNHYFLRYGSLFASAFLAGAGEALLKGGQEEQLVTTTTGAIVQRQAYDSRQLAMAGLGNVGKQASGTMTSMFNRPPTITINAGIGIGILFLKDLTLK